MSSQRRKAIRKWLLDHDITQRDIAAATGASTAAVALYIKGERVGGPVAAEIAAELRDRGCPFEILEIK
jgi:predicted transcriptional regulator